jgi:hypothetical protein
VSTGASVAVPAAAVAVAAVMPTVAGGANVAVPAAGIAVAGLVPELVGEQRTQALVPVAVVMVQALQPVVVSGASVAVPAAGVTVSGLVPEINPITTDPDFASVSLLLSFDGADGSTTFTDSSSNARTITRFGNTQISTAQSKFGGASALFEGSGNYLTSPYSTSLYDWLPSDYTIEAWVYATSWANWSRFSLGSIPCMVGNSSPTGVTAYWSFGPDATGKLKFFYFNGSEQHAMITTATLATSQWNHIAAVKTSSGITLYINGASSGGTFSISGTPQSSTGTTLTIGTYNNTGITGYIDDLRITKGVARYTANFTPPTEPFPDA